MRPSLLVLVAALALGGCTREPPAGHSIDLLSEPFARIDLTSNEPVEPVASLDITSDVRRMGTLRKKQDTSGSELQATADGDDRGYWSTMLSTIHPACLDSLSFQLTAPGPGAVNVDLGFRSRRWERSVLRYEASDEAQKLVLRWTRDVRDVDENLQELRIFPPKDVTGPVSLASVELHLSRAAHQVRAVVDHQARRALAMEPGHAVEWMISIASRTTLHFGIGVAERGHVSTSDGSRFEVELRDAEGASHRLWSGWLAPGHRPDHRRWLDVSLDLHRWAGQSVELSLAALPSPEILPPFERAPDARDDAPLFSAPVLAVSEEPGINVLIILIDSLTARALELHGEGGVVTAHLDTLAGESVVFDRAHSTAPWTLPSVVSLHTGLLPETHGRGAFTGVRSGTLPGVRNLAEYFKEEGYSTAMVSANELVGVDNGFAPGVDHLDERPMNGSTRFRGRRVTNAAIEWLDRHHEERFFLYLHYMDPHYPYQAPPPLTRTFVDDELEAQVEDPFVRQGNAQQMRLRSIASKSQDPSTLYSAQDMDYLHALYEAEILEVDRLLGELMRWLRARGLMDETLVIFTADHGEEFLEHGFLTHGHTVYEELLHVPLVIRFPDGTGRATRVDTPVSLRDLFATALSVAGIAAGEGMQANGFDLHHHLRAGTIDTRSEVFASNRGAGRGTGLARHGPKQSVISWPWKLIHSTESDRVELYRLDDDPLERTRVDVRAEAARVDRLRSAMEAALSRPENWQDALTTMSPAMLEKLKALGYVD